MEYTVETQGPLVDRNPWVRRTRRQLLLFRTEVDGSVTLLDEETGAEVVFTSREGNLVDVAQGGVTTTFEVVAPQGSGPLVVERQEADASETVFTEGADHSLTQALAGGGTDTWYDDGTRVRTSGGVTERFDADGTELSETDASGVTTYFRGNGTAEVRVWEDANGQVVRELTLANGSKVQKDSTGAVLSVCSPAPTHGRTKTSSRGTGGGHEHERSGRAMAQRVDQVRASVR